MGNKPTGSVGLVKTQTVKLPLGEEGLSLRRGGSLPELTVAYETYGELSPGKDNAVYICTTLTSDAHVAGRHDETDDTPGWWDEMIGPGKGIDTDYYYVVCADILGGCQGTTGPCSIDLRTGKEYGSSFPALALSDVVKVQRLLLQHLGVDRLAAVIGGSLGGMQALEWSIRYPDAVDRCICIASGTSLSAQALAFDAVARDAIVSDPHWTGGDYYDAASGPEWGLSHARKIGHITYLSPEIMQERFGRERHPERKDHAGDSLFQVESYLDHQGKKFVDRFDANSYLRITQAMDAFDLIEEFGSLEAAFDGVKAKFLVVALSSDWLFPPEQSVDLANALHRADKEVAFCTLEAPYGHDAFLVDISHLAETVRAFLPWVSGDDVVDGGLDGISTEHRLIGDMIQPGAKVLDLGCGDGRTLSFLQKEKRTIGFGVDIDLNHVIQCIDKGHDVFQADLDDGLSAFADGSCDCAVLGSTLQVVRKPRAILREMLRVAREGIVTFPNFANWKNRLTLGLRGRMPQSDVLPHEWYNTPNIHLTTLKDFRELCDEEGIEILEVASVPSGSFIDKALVAIGLRNLGASHVLARLARKSGD